MKTTAIKTRTGLMPTSEDDYTKIQFGEEVMIEWSKKRNPSNHRRFFKFIGLAFDLQDFYEDKEIFRKWLTMRAGYFDAMVQPNKNTLFIPKSIAFEKMGEPEFAELFGRCVDVFIDNLCRDLNRDDFMRVLDYV